jgi:serine/threonine-protein kinase
MESLFPGSGEIRAERKRTIDGGIADFARKQWAKRDTKQIPVVQVPPQPVSGPYEPIDPISEPVRPLPPPPPPPSGAYVAQRPAPPQPAPKPAPKPPAVTAPPRREEEEEEPPPKESSTPWVIFLLVIVVAASGYFAWSRANAPFEPKPREPIVDADPTPVKTVDVDAGAAAVVATAGDAGTDAGTDGATDAGPPLPVAPGDAGTPTAVVDAGAPAPVAPAEIAVSIQSSPILELTIDGTAVGKTPWSGPLAPGAHKLKLENKDLLISAGRTLTVQGAEPISQTFTFAKGSVTVAAPAGAQIFIDGKKQGVAPLPGELSIYEGFHRILVKVGQAQWTETDRKSVV